LLPRHSSLANYLVNAVLKENFDRPYEIFSVESLIAFGYSKWINQVLVDIMAHATIGRYCLRLFSKSDERDGIQYQSANSC
jgi:hypothetical protein